MIMAGNSFAEWMIYVGLYSAKGVFSLSSVREEVGEMAAPHLEMEGVVEQ